MAWGLSASVMVGLPNDVRIFSTVVTSSILSESTFSLLTRAPGAAVSSPATAGAQHTTAPTRTARGPSQLRMVIVSCDDPFLRGRHRHQQKGGPILDARAWDVKQRE